MFRSPVRWWLLCTCGHDDRTTLLLIGTRVLGSPVWCGHSLNCWQQGLLLLVFGTVSGPQEGHAGAS